jgi:hypothetical protein
MLNAKFAQFRGTRDAGAVGEWKRRASLFEHGNHDRHTLLFLDTKAIHHVSKSAVTMTSVVMQEVFHIKTIPSKDYI